MGPELSDFESSKAGPWSDIWSLGITAIELAEGLPPYAELSPKDAAQYIKKQPPPRLGMEYDSESGEKTPRSARQRRGLMRFFNRKKVWSAEFNDFLDKCLKKDPKDRSSALQLLSHPFILKYNQNNNTSGLKKMMKMWHDQRRRNRREQRRLRKERKKLLKENPGMFDSQFDENDVEKRKKFIGENSMWSSCSETETESESDSDRDTQNSKQLQNNTNSNNNNNNNNNTNINTNKKNKKNNFNNNNSNGNTHIANCPPSDNTAVKSNSSTIDNPEDVNEFITAVNVIDHLEIPLNSSSYPSAPLSPPSSTQPATPHIIGGSPQEMTTEKTSLISNEMRNVSISSIPAVPASKLPQSPKPDRTCCCSVM
jgi:serine/threonine protein kinase